MEDDQCQTYQFARSALAVVTTNENAVRRLPAVVAVPAALALAALVVHAADVGLPQARVDVLALAVVAAERVRLALYVRDTAAVGVAAANHDIEAADGVVKVAVVGAPAVAGHIAGVLTRGESVRITANLLAESEVSENMVVVCAWNTNVACFLSSAVPW
jgi:hypothetical protein